MVYVAVWTGCVGVDGGEDVGVDVASGKVVRLSCVGVDWIVSAGVGKVVGGCGWWCGWVVDVPTGEQVGIVSDITVGSIELYSLSSTTA